MRRLPLLLAVLLWPAVAAAQVFVPDKIQSTSSDGYVVDLSAVDGIPALAAAQCLQANAGGTALVFGACGTGGGGGATTFVGLTDTPSSLAASQCLAANATGTAVVFQPCSAGGVTTFTGLTGTPATYVTGSYLRSTSTALEYRTAVQVREDIGADNASNLTTGTVGDARIPAGIARDSEIVTTFVGLTETPSSLTASQCIAGNASGTALEFQVCTSIAAIDARIASWARLVNPTGTAPSARLGTGTASTATFLRGDGQWAPPHIADPSAVDARIASWARAFNPTGLVPEARLPGSLVHDDDLPIFIAGTGIAISTAGRNVTFSATGGGGGGGTADGVLASLNFDANAGQLTATLTQGAPVQVGGFPTISTIDGRIATFARTTSTATIPDARIPADIARDSELPVANPGGTGTALTTLTVGGTVYDIPTAAAVQSSTDMVLQWSDSTSSSANFAAVNTTTPTGLMPDADADVIALRARINGSHASAHNDWSEWHLLDAATYRALTVVDGVGPAPIDSQSYSVDSGGPPVDQHIFPVRVNGVVQLGWRGTTVAGPSVVEMRTARWVTVGGSGGGSTTFAALTDTPDSFTASQCLAVNTSGTAVVFQACATGGGGSDHYRGTWDSATAYAIADIVLYNADFWIARVASTNDTPSVGPNDSWLLMTEHGRFRGIVADSDPARFYQAGDTAVIDGDHLYEYLGQAVQSFNASGIRLGGDWVQLTNAVDIVTQAEATAGTETDPRLWSPQRVAQAIAALAPAGGGGTDGVVTDVDLVLSGSSLSAVITRSSGLSTLQDSVNLPNPADSVAPWARATNPTGTAPAARLGDSLGSGEFLYTTGGTTTWRTLNGAPLGGVTGDAVLVASGGTLSTLTTNTVGDVLTRTSAGYAFSTPTGGGGGSPTGNARGDLIATSSTLPTTALNEGAPLSNLWTAETGQSVTVAGSTLEFEYDRPEASIGVIVVARTGTTIVGEVFVPWSGTGGYFSTGITHGLQPLRISATAVMGVSSGMTYQATRPVGWDGAWEVQLVSGGDAIPASTVVTVYDAVVRGPAGPQGIDGTGTTDGVANSLGFTFNSSTSIATIEIGRSVGQPLTSNLFFPAASITTRGLVELATTAEADAGTAVDRVVTPAGLSSAIGDRLVRSDLVAGSNVTLTQGAGNAVTISAAGGGGTADGVANDVSFVFSGRTFTGTVERSIGGDLTDTATLPIASASSFGVLEIATAAEVNTGTDDTRAVTPLRLADRLRRSDIIAGSGVTITQGTGNTLTIASTGGGGGSSDGVANTLNYAFSGRTFTGTIGLSVGGPLSDSVDIPAASTTAQGLIEIATPAEASAGTDNTRAVSPAGLNQAQGNKLERSDIIAGNNVTITQGTGNTLTIASSGGGGGGTPTGDARGDLIATSSTLPTGALTEGTAFSNAWTVASGQSVTVTGNTLEFEYTRPEASIGVIVVARTGTTIVGEVFVPWSGTGGYFSTGITHGLQPLRLSSTAVMGVSSGMTYQGGRPVGWDGAWEVQLVSGGDAVPASTVVTVYDAVVRGAAGPQGVAGSGSAFDFYVDVPTEILTPTAGTRFLVAPINEAGEPNRWMGLSVLKEEVGPDIFAGNTLISGDASQIQFVGGGVSLADIIGTEAVTITIPGTVSTDATITGDGSPGSPLSAVGGGGGAVYQLLSEVEVGDPEDITAGLISGNRLDYFLERSRNGLIDLPSAEAVADDDEILIYNQSNSYIAARETISDLVGRQAGEGLVAVNDGTRTRLVVNYNDTGVETAAPAGGDYFGFTNLASAEAADQVKRLTFDTLRSLVRSAGGASADFVWSDSFTTLPHGQSAIENFQGTQRFFVGINPVTAPVLDEILRALVNGDHVTITQGSDTFVIRLTSGVTVHTDAATDVLRWNFAIVAGAEAFTAGATVAISFTDHVALIPAAWAEESSAALIPVAKLPPLADDAVGVDALNTATGHALIIVGDSTFSMHALSFFPWFTSTGNNGRFVLNNLQPVSTSGVPRVRGSGGSDCITASGCQLQWDYMTASDTPSVWVVTQDSDGSIFYIWEAEDPISDGDTVAPMTGPLDDTTGEPLPGYTVVNVGLPTFSVIESVYTNVLTAAQRSTMLTAWSGYMLGRGWIQTALTAFTAPPVTERYEPSSRQWAMRAMADAVGVPVTSFYNENLVITGGTWASPTQ